LHPDYLDEKIDAEELQNGGQRAATFIIYLSTVGEDLGGETVFPRSPQPPSISRRFSRKRRRRQRGDRHSLITAACTTVFTAEKQAKYETTQFYLPEPSLAFLAPKRGQQRALVVQVLLGRAHTAQTQQAVSSFSRSDCKGGANVTSSGHPLRIQPEEGRGVLWYNMSGQKGKFFSGDGSKGQTSLELHGITLKNGKVDENVSKYLICIHFRISDAENCMLQFPGIFSAS
jgi:hypothetical protein